MKLYENVVIGNFLYGLGFAIRARLASGSLSGVVNLLQQTPADTLLGDLLLEFPGVLRLIEFKANANKSTKEKSRHRALRGAVAVDSKQEAISRKVHWYIETEPSEIPGRAFTSRIVPYLDAYPAEAARGSLESFIDTLAAEAIGKQPSTTREAEAKYLQWVRLFQGDGEVGTGGILVVVDKDGGMHYAQLLDMLEFRLTHRQWIALHEARLEREIAYERDLEHARKLERRQASMQPERNRGPER